MSRLLVTGANGFVGRALCRTLLQRGHTVTGLVRASHRCIPGVQEWVHAGKDFDGIDAGWPQGPSFDAVIHLAARVHVMRDPAADPMREFRSTNVQGTLNIAEAAHRHGVRRMVFASSVKAIAEIDDGRPLREDAPPRPEDAYGHSKREAEQALIAFGARTGMEIVIVRPPLVYGPEVSANFLSLMTAVARGVPLPLGRVEARRSIVYVDNLAQALAQCATDPRAAGHCFHVADRDAPTVAALVRAIGRHLGKPGRLVPIPVSWLRLAGRVTGRADTVERLVSNLRLDTSHIESVLGWQPAFSTDEGLAATAEWYRSQH
ncbi:SDR family oxidoreductase [Pandoraea sp. ISTKB]|uniref:UDP-glucose 4-epimerase family protein n=1 Tax=Pandoraea sp. ISTKB TaxID=1586708 RepID=UPI00084732E2|nr:SDR family oxidoreductase [Pandoraea sp. ISTKB]ODP31241.1 NAD-dependent dehydratase [Pandoraea sp. ISTKB]